AHRHLPSFPPRRSSDLDDRNDPSRILLHDPAQKTHPRQLPFRHAQPPFHPLLRRAAAPVTQISYKTRKTKILGGKTPPSPSEPGPPPPALRPGNRRACVSPLRAAPPAPSETAQASG